MYNTINSNNTNNKSYKNISNSKINKNTNINNDDEEEENDQVNDLFPGDRNTDNKIDRIIYQKKSSNNNNKQSYQQAVNDNEENFDFDLREFINTKVKKNSVRPIVRSGPGHYRSNSTNLYKY